MSRIRPIIKLDNSCSNWFRKMNILTEYELTFTNDTSIKSAEFCYLLMCSQHVLLPQYLDFEKAQPHAAMLDTCDVVFFKATAMQEKRMQCV